MVECGLEVVKKLENFWDYNTFLPELKVTDWYVIEKVRYTVRREFQH